MMAPSAIILAGSSSNDDDATPSNNRRRSLSGVLLTRRFTKSSTATTTTTPRPTASKSESINDKRRHSISIDGTVHVRIVPSIENPSRSLIFDIVDRELEVGSVIKVGRYSERHANDIDCMSFRSKVVSRCHCEIWVGTDGKLYIRDTKSSSGTFLNHIRLSPAGNESRQVELHDGDIVQLGVDFQGGREEMYRSVKMRFELNRPKRPRPLSFNLTAFQNLRNLTQPQPINLNASKEEEKQKKTSNDDNSLEECCICLYALAPFQALFVSPCSHTYHYKCIRPLLKSHPGFQCPICRTYSDLEASVATEEEENELPNICQNTLNDTPPTMNATASTMLLDSGLALLEASSDNTNTEAVPNHHDEHPLSTDTTMPNDPLLMSSSTASVLHTASSPMELPTTSNAHDASSTQNNETEGIVRVEINEDDTQITAEQPPSKRERRSSHIMEKLKMVFFEKRKSFSSSSSPPSQQHHRRHKSNAAQCATSNRQQQQRPVSFSEGLLTSPSPSSSSPSHIIPPLPPLSSTLLSFRRRGSHSGVHYPNNNNASSSSLNRTLSRQSTTSPQLISIDEQQRLSFILEPMMVDN
ncbi:MAG: hypothetical protein EXX96DRAFT_582056 [Benjaminiella poitrasii]|nr:MAG: hypothetical protein EXX96DRAFT_582056 [Benjaminiella poitrasii]